MRVKVVNLHSMCENNTHALTRARSYFLVNGHTLADAADPADLVFIGGCTVTDQKRDGCLQQILWMMQQLPTARFIVYGCLAAFPEELWRLAASDRQRLEVVAYLQSSRVDELIGARIPLHSISATLLHGHVPYQQRIGPADAYVLIAQGCGNDCSYCNIKMAKGFVASRPLEVIEDEVRDLCRSGVTVITLLGDDCGSYGLDSGSDLPALLLRLAAVSPRLQFKLFTVFPSLYLRYARQLEPLFAGRRITYLCLPVQSAAPRILALMNRGYDPGALAAAIARLRSVAPGLFLYSHFIYNFPTETLGELEQSIAFSRQFNQCVFIGYGENRGTRAASITPKLSTEEAAARSRYLDELIRQQRLAAFLVPEP
jgi:tRNA A37 methylthiotransferase MiaB